MKLSGFSFVRNGIIFDYPFLESIQSILPICDEFVVAVGASDDDTLSRIRSLQSPKIKLLETTWDDSLRTGGAVLAQQTNLALDHVTGNWAFYLQADEIVHEQDHAAIRDAVERYDADRRVEGLLFSYHHFYGSYKYVGDSRRWYRREIRIIRTGIGVRSWGDAQGFRNHGRKLNVKPVNASIFHYGWVKPPEKQQAKQRHFNRYWHDDQWVHDHVGDASEYDYLNGGTLALFQGSHPAVMQKRISSQQWAFTYDSGRVRVPFKERALNWLERKTGIRIGEYRNYRLI